MGLTSWRCVKRPCRAPGASPVSDSGRGGGPLWGIPILSGHDLWPRLEELTASV